MNPIDVREDKLTRMFITLILWATGICFMIALVFGTAVSIYETVRDL